MTGTTRSLACSLVVIACFCAFSAIASAGITNGTRYRNLGGSDNGSRVYLAGSGTTHSNGKVEATVGILQNDSSQSKSKLGTFQMGEQFESDLYADDCGTGLTAVFVEYKSSGSTTYVCPKTSGISTFGNGGLFDVVYASGGWEAFWNSNLYYSSTPNLFYANGWSIAHDEAFVVVGEPEPAEAMTFGPSGQTPWQYSTSSSGGYNTIATSLVWQNDDIDGPDGDNDWHMGGTPSPFNINWSGF